jgi:hypothetical protein
MSLWIKLYRAIILFVVRSENITCHWEFSTHRASLRLVHIICEGDFKHYSTPTKFFVFPPLGDQIYY